MQSDYVIVDLEATCWPKGTRPNRMEIIEIGAVRLGPDLGPIVAEFDAFVRPVNEPELSDFCTELTGIRQEDVDRADPFPVVFRRFLEWIGPEPFVLCSWGAYDLRQFRVDCERHSVPFPEAFEERHVNVKAAFARWKGIKPVGMRGALGMLGLPLEGRHHRAIDDVRNIAKVARVVIPETVEMLDDWIGYLTT